jgi:L-aminopeptidase/D-esterase-like protein
MDKSGDAISLAAIRRARPGPRNLITDVPGLFVGNAEDHQVKTGTTVLVGERPFCAAVDIMGGAPGARETDLLAPDKLVEEVDALFLSGGSAFGLDAGSGIMDGLRAQGRGLRVETATIPIVPGAILFDMVNGGDKGWRENPYRALGAAALAAAGPDFALGTAGAGVGATTVDLKGGLGSASLVLADGTTVGVLVAANPTGSVTMGDGANFWAAPFEIGDEFGGIGPFAGPLDYEATLRTKRTRLFAVAATTIAIVATDAALSKAQLKRLAVAAQDGMARAISPSHTPVDGDLVFAVSTGVRPLADPIIDAIGLGHAAATCLARAIARAVYLATPAVGDLLPTWREKWGRAER